MYCRLVVGRVDCLLLEGGYGFDSRKMKKKKRKRCSLDPFKLRVLESGEWRGCGRGRVWTRCEEGSGVMVERLVYGQACGVEVVGLTDVVERGGES